MYPDGCKTCTECTVFWKFSCSFKLHPQSRQIMFEPFHTKIKSSKIQQVLLLKDAKLMKN